MERESHCTRRDSRHPVPPGVGFVEFHSGEILHRRPITSISVAGLTMELPPNAGIRADRHIPRCQVRVGECCVEGELFVKYGVSGEEGRTELGCLFYPSSTLAAEKWSAMVSVLHAAVEL